MARRNTNGIHYGRRVGNTWAHKYRCANVTRASKFIEFAKPEYYDVFHSILSTLLHILPSLVCSMNRIYRSPQDVHTVWIFQIIRQNLKRATINPNARIWIFDFPESIGNWMRIKYGGAHAKSDQRSSRDRIAYFFLGWPKKGWLRIFHRDNYLHDFSTPEHLSREKIWTVKAAINFICRAPGLKKNMAHNFHITLRLTC